MSAKKCNFHTHSQFCDGKNTAEEMVLSAIKKGFDVLGFSSHCMHPLNPQFYKPFDHIWHIPSENIKAYTEEIRRLKEKYADKIKIYLGFEADYFASADYGSAIPAKSDYSEFSEDFDNAFMSMRNIPEAAIVTVEGLNVYDIVNADKIVFTETAAEKAGEVFAK